MSFFQRPLGAMARVVALFVVLVVAVVIVGLAWDFWQARNIDALLAGFLVLFACLPSVVLVQHWMTKLPLKSLVDAVTQIEAGEEPQSLDSRRGDAWGRIAGGFKLLLERLRHTVAEHELMREELRHQAYHDELTGLPNRKSFVERLEAHYQLATRVAMSGALILIDLDHFKAINDTLGFSVGDKILQIVSQRLRNQIRQTDELFRLEADVFAVLATTMSHGEDAALVAQKILQALQAPFQVENRMVHLDSSIGIARLPQDGGGPSEVFKNADTALVDAQSERGVFRFFTPDMQLRAQERLKLITQLHTAVRSRAFEPFFQIQVDPHGVIVGAEVLVRWKTENGYVLPDVFIPIAEETNLILPLGRQVLEDTAKLLKKLHGLGKTELELWVNLSVRQLQSDGFARTVNDIVKRWDVSPLNLKFEITEGALQDETKALRLINKLRSQGFVFAVDDFGTGYSSLSRIKKLPVDVLKIDKSFVFGLADKKVDRDLAAAIVTLAHDMGMRVVAEGIEKPAQQAVLDQLGCDFYQGNLFSKPVPESEFLRLLGLEKTPES